MDATFPKTEGIPDPEGSADAPDAEALRALTESTILHRSAEGELVVEAPPRTESASRERPTLASIRPGDLFLGKYEIQRQIGTGGFGVVYLARNTGLDAQCAIKVLHRSNSTNPELIERFKREARTCAQVEHPNAVRVYDFGEVEGSCYLVMEYLPGESLKERLARTGRSTVGEVLPFVSAVCDVLSVMHRKKIIHRDLKPDNIVFHAQEDIEVVKVLDFGVAKLAETTQMGALSTRTGTVVGTPMYMSPEQCQGLEIDGRSDIYSLGVILYQMLTGRLPFVAENMFALMYLHVNQPVRPAHEVEPTVPKAISDVVTRMLEKEPHQRYDTPVDCAAALFQAASVPMPARATSGRLESAPDQTIRRADVPPAVRAARRKVPLVWLAAALVVAIVAVAIWFAIGTGERETDGDSVASPTRTPAPTDSFVLIPAGRARIGHDVVDVSESHPSCVISDDEAPAHDVELASYFLSKFEVTNQEYKAFVDATGRPAPRSWKNGMFLQGTEMYPVAGVSWREAVAYCEWLTQRDGVQYRLPSEEEWEHAARRNEDRLWPWNSIWNSSYANGDKHRTAGSVMPVDKAPNNTEDRSPFGIFAMAGNVAEWTSSRPEPYPQSSWPRPKGIESLRVVRGGGFNTIPDGMRTTCRVWYSEDKANDQIGFRLAATPPDSAEPNP